VMKSTVYTYV